MLPAWQQGGRSSILKIMPVACHHPLIPDAAGPRSPMRRSLRHRRKFLLTVQRCNHSDPEAPGRMVGLTRLAAASQHDAPSCCGFFNHIAEPARRDPCRLRAGGRHDVHCPGRRGHGTCQSWKKYCVVRGADGFDSADAWPGRGEVMAGNTGIPDRTTFYRACRRLK